MLKFKSPIKVRQIRSIRSNPVNFFWFVIRSGSGPVPAKMIPIRSGSGSVRIFDPVAHWSANWCKKMPKKTKLTYVNKDELIGMLEYLLNNV